MENAHDDEPSIEIPSFTAVEELNQANCDAGWDLEYRQLDAGRFSAQFAVRQCSEELLMQERYRQSIEVRGGSPRGSMAVIMTWNPVKRGALNGRDLMDGQVHVLRPGAEIDAVIVGGLKVDSFYLRDSAFEQAVTAIGLSSAPSGEIGLLDVTVDKRDHSRLRQTFYTLFSAIPGSIGSQELDPKIRS